jgi:hypothetical protein
VRVSGIGYCGLGSGAMRIEVFCTDAVVQWLAQGARRGTIRPHGIGCRSFLFGKLQVLGRFGEVITLDFVASFGIGSGGGALESTAVSGLLEEPVSGPVLSARRLLSSTSESEAFDSSSPGRTIGLSTPCQKKILKSIP